MARTCYTGVARPPRASRRANEPSEGHARRRARHARSDRHVADEHATSGYGGGDDFLSAMCRDAPQ
jgi:hypothetical protein